LRRGQTPAARTHQASRTRARQRAAETSRQKPRRCQRAAGSKEKIAVAGHSRPKDGVASVRLCPAIHVWFAAPWKKKDVDARHKAGHDESCPLTPCCI